MELDQADHTYRWENVLERSWDTVKEDASGNIMTISDDHARSKRARMNRGSQSIRRGLIRFLVVALDCSISAAEKDYAPSRLQACKIATEKFVHEYYDQNPISQMSIITSQDGVCEELTKLSGNSKAHIKPIKKLIRTSGSASLRNIMIRAMASLEHVPDYGHKECLIIYNSLSTCDPGFDVVVEAIKIAKKKKVHFSVICLAAELYICRKIAEETMGTFNVAIDPQHLSELLMQHTVPPAEVRASLPSHADMVYMGFPKRTFEASFLHSFEGHNTVLSRQVFVCPRCSTRTTDIPVQCQVCALQLNASSHIARSHHHLFPVINFVELKASAASSKSCNACFIPFNTDSMRLQCPLCTNIFCVECDIFIHDSLHNCPGCGSAPQPTIDA